MKITVICDVLGKANNGTTLAALNLIGYLKEAGHCVTVVSPDQDREGAEGFVSVPVLNLGKPVNSILERNGVQLAKPSRELIEPYIRDCDVVHLLVPFPLARTALKLAKKYAKPVTASFHCQAENVTSHIGLMGNKAANRVIYKNFYKCVYRYCDAVHYPTEFIRDVFEECTGKTNAYVISNGVNDAFSVLPAKENNEKFTIVCTGRFSKEKAQRQLIRAMALSKHKNEIEVCFAGCGPDKPKLERLAKKLEIDCSFKFYSRDEMVSLLHHADLYVHTAEIEIEAIACMEAISCGLVPVICDSERSATRFFALSENNLFENGNVNQLAQRIDYWFENREELKKCSDEYSAVRAGFSQKECMRQMEAMLCKAAEKNA